MHPTTGALSGGEGLARTEHVVGAEDQADATEGGVGEIDVDVGVGESTCHLTQRAGLSRQVASVWRALSTSSVPKTRRTPPKVV